MVNNCLNSPGREGVWSHGTFVDSSRFPSAEPPLVAVHPLPIQDLSDLPSGAARDVALHSFHLQARPSFADLGLSSPADLTYPSLAVDHLVAVAVVAAEGAYRPLEGRRAVPQANAVVVCARVVKNRFVPFHAV